ncbi:MAG: ABC transporter ATP-binding protein [Euryarchaeota archaeon]|nr:ABC transporter ATP-binding protein [Euryarchaeota archaeon]|tara:strand:+ start:656 stop:1426 length:771 start_codon:yes stop_codon:yes gene_type:complete
MSETSDAMPPLVTLRGVSKRFGDVVALDDVTTDLNRHTSTALIGGNGAGKTTLLRILAGVYRPTEGSATFTEGDLTAHRRKIGVMTESTGLHLRLTAWENIRFHARLFGIDDHVARERSEALAIRLGLGAALDRRTEGFSRGMRQKTALMRALVHEPELLLLDEPTAGLDITSARAVRALIESLVDEGRGVMWSTHDLTAANICGRVMVMHNGRLVADGSLEGVLEEHESDHLEDLYLTLTNEATPEFKAGMEAES